MRHHAHLAVAVCLAVAGVAQAQWTEQDKLVSTEANHAYKNYGWSVGVHEETAIAGTYLGGAAYVSIRSGTSWSPQAQLTPTGAVGPALASGNFGISVSVWGDVALVGADNDGELGTASGAAYVFQRSGGTWSQAAKLTASDGAAGNQLGASVDVFGDTAVVGAAMAGAAYVFRFVDANWVEVAKLTALDGVSGDMFGTAVAISDGRIIVGAPYADVGGVDKAGAAYIFSWVDSNWIQTSKFTPAAPQSMGEFGLAADLDGNTAITGELTNIAGLASGSAYLFEESGGTWSAGIQIVPSEPNTLDLFGTAVSVCGQYAAVGAYNKDPNGLSNAGAVYLFDADSNWAQVARLTASDAASNDVFGIAVAIHDLTVVIGAAGDDNLGGTDAGAAYVFVPEPGTLTIVLLFTGWAMRRRRAGGAHPGAKGTRSIRV
ncbi:MAG TPA: hypothetical protein VNA25_29445 [Phycisphaerae bacterium]|nr:hypothetical protein [Phycisphaerae bacterium]